MYIRWVTRKHKSALSAPMVFHDAYLVESYRDERGSPRQRTICYLGNLRQIDGRIPHIESELFLSRAARTLQQTALATPVDCALVLDELRRSLPEVTPDTVRRVFGEQVRWFYDWWAQHGSSHPDEELALVLGDVLGVRERTT